MKNINYPLNDIRILDLSRLLPGAYCSQILSDYGAKVLKVEDPVLGDYMRYFPPILNKESAYFLSVNRNKKSIKLNLKTEKGLQIFFKLAKRYNVIIESFRPGVMDKLGIGYGIIKKINPAMIFCSISGFGQDGPYRDKVGHDINYIGYGGVLDITGEMNGPPAIPGVQIGDIGGGGMLAAIAILIAVIGREKHGEGQYIDISMLDGIISWLAIYGGKYLVDGLIPERGKLDLNGGIAGYNIYKTKDGKYLTLGIASEDKFWKALCSAIGRKDLLDRQFDEDQSSLKSTLQEIFLSKKLDEWQCILQNCETCFGPVNSIEEAFMDPQVIHRKLIFGMDHPTEGKIKQIRTAINFSETKQRAEIPPPGYGEHTDQILREIGYDDSSINDLRKEGII